MNGTQGASVVSASAKLRILNDALRQLPALATAKEKQLTLDRARTEFEKCGPAANEMELIQAAARVVECESDEIRLRLRLKEWCERAPGLLPWSATDEDRREAADLTVEALEELPIDLSDSEVERRIRQALKPLFEEIKADQRIETLIQHGRGRVNILLSAFYREGTITPEEYLDSDLQRELEETVVEELGEDGAHSLEGSETEDEIADMVEEIVCDEMGLDVDPNEETG